MSEPPRKRGRGANKNAWLNDLKEGEKLHIELDEKNRPVGPNQPKLAQYIGILARDGTRFPITRPDWSAIDEENKKKAISDIKEYIDVPDDLDEYLKGELNSKWKDHKCATKRKYYTDVEDKSECGKAVPPGIVPSQWFNMLELWENDDDVKNLAARNARNRAALKLCHTLGSRSLAQVSHEFRHQNNRNPTRVDLFQKCYTSKDKGVVVNPIAAELLKKMENKRDNAMQSTDGEVDDSPGPNDIFAQVMGRERGGRIRLMPHVKPKDLFPRKSSVTNKKIDEEISNMKQENVELREELSSLKAQMKELMNMMRSQGAGSSSQGAGSSSQGAGSSSHGVGSSSQGQ